MLGRILYFAACAGLSLHAARFEDGQAARAVLGQASFSSSEKTITPRAISLSDNLLHVADVNGHVFSYDLTRIGKSVIAGCPVCLPSPQVVSDQNVFEGVSASATYGSSVAIADTVGKRVLFWRGVSPKPSVVLSGFSNPVSVALDGHRLFVGDSGTHHVYVWEAWPTADMQAPDATLGATDLQQQGAGADTLTNPSAILSDGVNLYVGDANDHRVSVFTPADASTAKPINAASLAEGSFAPGTLVTIEQPGEGAASVLLNGEPLPVTDRNGPQLQVQIPFNVTGAAASLWLRFEKENGVSTNTRAIGLRFAPASPGIFAFGAKEPRNGLALHAPEGVPLSPERPARANEKITLWTTGLGAVSSVPNADDAFDTLTPVYATLGGAPVEVISASLPRGSKGVYEVTLRLPNQFSGAEPLLLIQNDAESNSVIIPLAKSASIPSAAGGRQ